MHADSVVLDALSTALHPQHGTLVMNLHGGGMPTANALMALFTSWLPFGGRWPSSGYHPSTEKGRQVQQVAHTLRYIEFHLTCLTDVALLMLPC